MVVLGNPDPVMVMMVPGVAVLGVKVTVGISAVTSKSTITIVESGLSAATS